MVAASESASTEQQADAAEPKVSATGEIAQVQSQALPNYYEKKYMVGSPAHYSMEEIQTRLKNLADRYPEFQTIYDHMDQYPEALLNNLCCNPNMLDFALGYQENYDTTSGTLEASELDGIPLFIQWDKRWGYDAYGNDVIGLSGCGPTCLSMIVIGLTKIRRQHRTSWRTMQRNMDTMSRIPERSGHLWTRWLQCMVYRDIISI